MKNVKMLRPLFILGIIVIGFAVFGWLTKPAFSNSPIGWTTLFLAIVIGLAAIVKDMVAFARDVKETKREDQG